MCSKYDRALRRARKLRLRLGGDPADDEYPDKPPRMRWTTYHRLMDKLVAAKGTFNPYKNPGSVSYFDGGQFKVCAGLVIGNTGRWSKAGIRAGLRPEESKRTPASQTATIVAFDVHATLPTELRLLALGLVETDWPKNLARAA